jgi:hypothetical protein
MIRLRRFAASARQARGLMFIAMVCVFVAGTAAGAQPPAQKTPPPPQPPAAAQPQPAPPSEPQATPSSFSYKVEGRRDPFVSLLGQGPNPRTPTVRPSGIAGVLISEAVVTGIWKGGGGFIAMLRAPDNKTYIVRPGDKLLDGTVKTITQTQVVFSQDVNDPLSLVKQREIPKSVRPGGESQ